MKDYKFNYLINELCFCPSRDNNYPSKRLKRKAKHALHILWNTELINILGKFYNKLEIQKLLIEELTLDMLDEAIEFYSYCQGEKSVYNLAHYIMYYVIFSETLADILYDRHQKIKERRAKMNEELLQKK